MSATSRSGVSSPRLVHGNKGPHRSRLRGSGAVNEKQARFPSSTHWNDISDYARSWSHVVCGSDVECLKFCVESGIPHRVVDGTPLNPHSISHVCRDEAFRQVLMIEGRGLKRMKVLDWFGSGRNLKFSPNRGPKGTCLVNGRVHESSGIFKIDFTFGPTAAIKGDAGRSQGDYKREIYPEELFHVVIVQDIYHDGPTPTSRFTPRTVISLGEYALNKSVYIVNRSFVGVMGCDNVSETKIEQIFYRDVNGLIVSSPDETSAPYPAHPDTDWLFNYRSLDGVDITPLQNYGPFKLVRCVPTYENAQEIGVQNRLPELVTLEKVCPASFPFIFGKILPIMYVHPHVYDSTHWLLRKCFGMAPKSVVYKPTFHKLHNKFVLKQPNGQILDSAFASVERELSHVPLYRGLSQRFPDQARLLLDGTAQAVMYSDKKRIVGTFYDLRRAQVQTERRLTETRSGATPQTEGGYRVPKWLKMLLKAAVVGMSGVAIVAHRSFLYSALKKILSACWPVVELLAKEFVKLWSRAPAGALLLPKYPLISAVLEEVIMFFFPNVGRFIVACEFAKGSQESFSGSLVTLTMHLTLDVLRTFTWHGRYLSPLLHILWNLAVRTKENIVRYNVFVEAYNKGEFVDPMNGWCGVPADHTLPSYVSTVTSGLVSERGDCSIFVDGEKLTASEALESLSGEVGRNVTFPILITNRLLHQPANVSKNLLVAILSRTHQDPFSESEEQEIRFLRWSLLADTIISARVINSSDIQFDIEECYRLMGSKATRIRNALDAFTEGRFLSKGKTINLKWNETLSVTKLVGDSMTMKPRAIQNLPAEVHGIMSPFARHFDHVMHTHFDGQILEIQNIKFRIVYASGFNGEKLSSISTLFSVDEFVIVVSGDDSVVSLGHLSNELGLPRFAEADQSAFDHTQDDGPMLHFQSAIQESLGLPVEFTQLAYQCCKSSYTARKGRLFVKGNAGTQMPTGITTTTCFNSFSTIAFWLYWALELRKRPRLDPVLAGKELGFKVKYVSRDDFTELTFLKGWWMATLGERFVWYPLPSALLKLGKVITDPVEITSTIVRGKRKHLERGLSVQMCAFALASSYGTVSDDYPIFGSFLACLKRLGVVPRKALRRLEEGWKPACEAAQLCREKAVDQIYERYLITENEITEVENLFRNVDVLPAYVEHNVFDKLANLDYS